MSCFTRARNYDNIYLDHMSSPNQPIKIEYLKQYSSPRISAVAISFLLSFLLIYLGVSTLFTTDFNINLLFIILLGFFLFTIATFYVLTYPQLASERDCIIVKSWYDVLVRRTEWVIPYCDIPEKYWYNLSTFTKERGHSNIQIHKDRYTIKVKDILPAVAG